MNSSNPDIKVKKRYNKFMAFLLANGVVATVLYIVMLAGGIANGSEIDAASLGVIFITLFITVIITLLIFKNTPKEERAATWFRCFKMGIIISVKLGFAIFIFTIPFLIKTSTRYYEFDYTGYVDGNEIRLKKLDRGKYEDMEGNVYYINT